MDLDQEARAQRRRNEELGKRLIFGAVGVIIGLGLIGLVAMARLDGSTAISGSQLAAHQDEAQFKLKGIRPNKPSN